MYYVYFKPNRGLHGLKMTFCIGLSLFLYYIYKLYHSGRVDHFPCSLHRVLAH